MTSPRRHRRYFDARNASGDQDASPALQQLQVQFQDIQRTLEDVSKRVEQVSGVGPGDANAEAALADEVQSLKEDFLHLQETSQALTAPVRIPTPGAMQVTLVPVHVLDRLEEYRSDESTWLTFCGLFMGAILGVFVNVATGGKLAAASWIVLSVFALMAALTGAFAWQTRRRSAALKKQHLGTSTASWEGREAGP
jgi:hypothetical protein